MYPADLDQNHLFFACCSCHPFIRLFSPPSPLSERYGRKWIFIIAFIPYTGFQVGCALSKNIGSLLVFRFLGGCFAASPLTTSGGVSVETVMSVRRASKGRGRYAG